MIYAAHYLIYWFRKNAGGIAACAFIVFFTYTVVFSAFVWGQLLYEVHAQTPAKPETAAQSARPIPAETVVALSKVRNAFETARQQNEAIKKQIDQQAEAAKKKADEDMLKVQQSYVAAIQKAQKDLDVPATCFPDDEWNWKQQTGPNSTGPCQLPKEEKK